MKTTNILAATIILFLASCSKDSNESKKPEMPKVVEDNFKAQNPTTKDVKWEKEGDLFEAEFEDNGMEKSIVYDKNGNVIATESEIAVADLPSAITQYITDHYNSYSIEEAEKEEKSDGTFFEVQIESGEQEMDLIFDSQGQFVKQEIEDEKEEGNNKEDKSNS